MDVARFGFDDRAKHVPRGAARGGGLAFFKILTMSPMGHSRRFLRVDGTSGYPPKLTVRHASRRAQWCHLRYELLDVQARFGGESLQNLQTLPRSILYLPAPASWPPHGGLRRATRAGASR
jgi:hypothetical protein